MENPYQFVLEMYDQGGTRLGPVPLEVDWEPAEEWTRFRAVRDGRLSPANPGAGGRVDPLWHNDLGAPYTRGFCVRMESGSRREVEEEFGQAYFSGQAHEASSRLVEKGQLLAGETFTYLVTAFLSDKKREDVNGSRFEVEQVIPPFPLRKGNLADLLCHASSRGTQEKEDIPIFIPQRLLSEASNLARGAGSVETGGVLIGHLVRDPGVPEIFVKVTDQIPARHTVGDSTRLRFTAETWTEAQGVLDLRKQEEIMVGTWHSHPVHEWCKHCPVERRRNCPLSFDFFSTHDRALHRTVFPRAYGLALVVNDIGTGEPTHSCFGWRKGLLQPRGFHVLESPTPQREETIAEPGEQPARGTQNETCR